MNPIELELKLSPPPEMPMEDLLQALHAFPGPLPPPECRQLSDVYLDTRKGELRCRGWGLRCRTGTNSVKVTLKSLNSEAPDLMARQEIEVSGPPGSSWESLIREEAFSEMREWTSNRTLETLFTLVKDQIRWKLFPEADLAVELTLDRVQVREHPEIPPFSELELELKHGERSRFRAFALRLRDHLGLPVASASKLERVWAYLD